MRRAKRMTGLVLLVSMSMIASCSGGSAERTAPTLVVYPDTPLPPAPRVGYRVQFEQAPWVRDPSSTPDSLVIRVAGVGGMPNCADFDHADVWETATTVTIRVYDRILNPAADGFGCADVGMGSMRLRIPLAAPLGDRSLVGDCYALIQAVPAPTWPTLLGCQALSSGSAGQR